MRLGVNPLLVLLLAVASLTILGATPAASAASSSTVTATIQGPSALGEGLQATYVLNASGGPGQAANGSYIGTFTYKASLIGPDTVGALVSPPSAVLSGGTAKMSVKAPNSTESLQLSVEVTSSYAGKNASTNTTFTISIIQPYRISAMLVVGNQSISGFGISVLLDGVPVGTINVPSLTAQNHYPISFAYAATSLTPGWHAFSINLAQEHGLVSFAGGADQFSSAFYVPGPAPDYTIYYIAGTVAFFGAIFIWTTRVNARRRGRARS